VLFVSCLFATSSWNFYCVSESSNNCCYCISRPTLIQWVRCELFWINNVIFITQGYVLLLDVFTRIKDPFSTYTNYVCWCALAPGNFNTCVYVICVCGRWKKFIFPFFCRRKNFRKYFPTQNEIFFYALLIALSGMCMISSFFQAYAMWVTSHTKSQLLFTS
jgi:hypothetical protein